jgi:hypothetical protein
VYHKIKPDRFLKPVGFTLRETLTKLFEMHLFKV